MDSLILNSIRNFESTDRKVISSLLSSEGFFWLSTAVALSFSVDEIQGENRAESSRAVELFTNQLRTDSEQISDDVVGEAKKISLEALGQLKHYLEECCVFNKERAVPICQSFIKYWLFTKLVDLEWQMKLDSNDLIEIYQFLDGIIEDQEELGYIAEKVSKQEPLYDDEMVYLRTHFKNAGEFFRRLESELQLLSLGHIAFRPN